MKLAVAVALSMFPSLALAHPGSVLRQRDQQVALPQAQAPMRAKSLSVLILSGEEAGLALSEVYSAAQRAIERHTPHDVAPLDTIGLSDRQTAIRECAGRAACFVERLRGVSSSDLLLTVSVDRLDDGLLLGLRLIDVRSREQIGVAGDEIPAGMSISGAMESKLADVFPASVWDQIGGVQVETSPSNAEVSIGNQACASPCNLDRLAPGTYKVVARKSGFDPWQGDVTIRARQTSKVMAELQEPSGGGLLSSPWFWGAVAAVVAGGAVTGALLATRSSDSEMVCIAATPEQCQQ